MKWNKAEKAAVLLTLLFLVFAVGAHWGSARMHDKVTIVTEKSQPAKTEESLLTKGPLPGVPQEVPEQININTADKETLMELDGIGEKLAERIMAYREENGQFEKIEDITRVSGIGSGIYSRIFDKITV